MQHCHNTIHEDHDMLRTFIISPNTPDNPGGRNAGNLDSAFVEVNGIIYDNYEFADPLVGSLAATTNPQALVNRAEKYLEANFYRIFYPLPGDVEAVLNNPWLVSEAQCE